MTEPAPGQPPRRGSDRVPAGDTAIAPADLISRAAVVVSFELGSFAAADDDLDALMAFLAGDCQRILTASGSAWTLADDVRRRCFAAEPLNRLRWAREAARTVPDSPVQAALDRSLDEGWSSSDLRALTPENARALNAVAHWWDGTRPEVPDVETANLLVDRLNLFADLRTMAADHFTGRDRLLSDLRRHYTEDPPQAFAIYGLGGIGKSALIAQHVVWTIDDGGGRPGYAAVIDFDDPTANPRYLDAVVARIVVLLARQAEPGQRLALDRLALVAQDAASTSKHRSESNSRATGSETSGSAESILRNVVSQARRPLLVVFDTVEQVQRRGPSAEDRFGELVDVLCRTAGIQVMLCGRILPEGLRAVDGRELTGLGRTEAIRLLDELCQQPVDDRTAAAVIDALGTSPLTVRLAARLLSDESEDAGDLITLELHAERINAELYRRVLEHVRDPQVRRIAHPGLVLRRITPELIQRVLAKPCVVQVDTEWEAQDLFTRLALEGMLVERSADGSVLVHRSDVRQVMLPQLLADKRDVARRIQRAAVRYYAAMPDDLEAKVEELYHRLMLEQLPATLDKHWTAAAADRLVPALDELPGRSRIYLTRRLPDTYLRDEDRQLIGNSAWQDEIEPQVERLISAGGFPAAVRLLHERRGPGDRSLLPALEIEALEALDDLPAAIEVARAERQAASIANDPEGVTTYTLHLTRLLERIGQVTDAHTALAQARRTIQAPALAQLRIVVAQLGLWRRAAAAGAGVISDDEYQAARQAAADLQGTVGDREIRSVPGLLRDLAGEVSDIQPSILVDALSSIGIDASAEGGIPGALHDLDAKVTTGDRKSTGLLAKLLDLTPEGDLTWANVVYKPRGETGRALAEILRTFRADAGDVQTAVAADYQQESDAALLGYQRYIAPKA